MPHPATNIDNEIANVAQSNATLALALASTGEFYLQSVTDDSDPLTATVAARIREAFAFGGAHGVLHLALIELMTTLPPSLAFGRELAKQFMTGLCATPDLASVWQNIEIAAPLAELEALSAAAPPFTGVEYLDRDRLQRLWTDMLAAAKRAIDRAGGIQNWLAAQHHSWHAVGRVCFHLAENKGNEAAPFAFLATYAARLTEQARVQHLPLSRALQDYASDNTTLLALLLPVHQAAEQSPWVKSLVESGAIYHPLAWSTQDAYCFLREIPMLESAGVVVRIPDWWKPRQPPRPQLRISVGNKGAGLGFEAMLDFHAELTLDGESLSQQDIERLLAAGEGLVRIKGRWVEVDAEKLKAVLAHWRKVERQAGTDGLSFLEGMRLLAGASLDNKPLAEFAHVAPEWVGVVPGAWLQGVLDSLHDPTSGTVHPGEALKAELRPYQQAGLRWLYLLNRLGLGGCLADDMGLGKTVQVIALWLLLKREGETGPHLLVAPASLLANWQAELTRFAPSLRVLIAHPSAMSTQALAKVSEQQLANVDVVLTSYGTITRLDWVKQTRWSLVVLDEAQAIKNPGTQQTRAVKALSSRVRLALTGTPIENRLGDLWSLFDFICPGLLGTAQMFGNFARKLAQDPQQGYAPLRALVRPYLLRRMKTDKRVIADLPDKSEMKTYCALSRRQAALYQNAVDTLAKQLATLTGIGRRGVVLAFLMQLKQICNHPSHWQGDHAYAPEDSGKFARLRELAEAIAARQEKVLIFTQFQEMTEPLQRFLAEVFGEPGLILHGGTPVKVRQQRVDMFQNERAFPFFVLSLKAGGSGLNLTAASHVIHFDRWWNPAVENQATDRAYRIGQHKNVLVHKFICRGTVEEKIDALIEAKANLSTDIIEGGAESITEMSNAELMNLVQLDLKRAMQEA